MPIRRVSVSARILALSLALLPFAGSAKANCSVCVETQSVGGVTELRGVNNNNFPVTVRLQLSPVNMSVEQGERVVQPGESALLARLRVEDAQRSSDFRYRLGWARGDYRVAHDDSYVYSLPFKPGAEFLVSQGYNGEYSHNGSSSYGIDFAMPEGTPVLAARDGVVISVKSDSNVGGPDRRFESKANYVVIQHADGTFAEYLHLRHQGVLVKPGDRVRRGQHIAFSGNTGFSGGPHLHFMVAGATADGGRRSFPVSFRTSEGVLAELQRGTRYQSVPSELADTGAMLAEQPVENELNAVGDGG